MVRHKSHQQGIEKYELKDYSEAVRFFGLALLDEENPNIYYDRALAFLYMNDLPKAIADLNHALELEPYNPFRYSSRAYVRDKMGDVKGAIEDYKKAIEIDPEDAIAQNNLGMLEEKMGYMESAKARYKAADELSTSMGTEPPTPNFVKEPVPEKTEPVTMKDYLKTVSEVFLSKKGFGEFMRFLKNGFKTDK